MVICGIIYWTHWVLYLTGGEAILMISTFLGNQLLHHLISQIVYLMKSYQSTLLEESRNIILQLNNEQWHAFDCITYAVLLNKLSFFLFLVMEALEKLFSGRQ
jgi:hypothetical protein